MLYFDVRVVGSPHDLTVDCSMSDLCLCKIECAVFCCESNFSKFRVVQPAK